MALSDCPRPIARTSLTRRTFVKLGAAALILPPGFRGSPRESWSFAVFSDTHFGIAGHLEVNRVLLEEIADHAPELALNAGDVTERGWAEEYDDVDRAFSGLPYSVHSAPGNHEVRWAPRGLRLFEERVGPAHRIIEHRGCVFALLDSTVPLSHWGHVGGPQRRWLADALEPYGPDAPVFVALHHAPGREPAVLDDEHALADTLARFNTKVVFTGHGHRDLLWEWRGLTLTMGRGLYQGTYQHVIVDPDEGEVRVYRRTEEAPALSPVVTVPLARTGRPMTPSAPDPKPEATGALSHRWSHALGAGVMSRLLLTDDTLYLSGMDGRVVALDPRDGRLRWEAATRGTCHSSPVLAGTSIIVGSADASVHAFDAASGAARWRVETRGPVWASAAFARGIVAIASGDGVVYGIDVDDGRVAWTFPLPEGPSAFAQSPAATDGERFFIGAWDRHVYALDAGTGRMAWRYVATPSSFYYSAAIAGPAVGDGRLFVPSNDNTLHALDASTGAVLWTRQSEGDRFGHSSPTLVGDRIYVGCIGDHGEVHCLAADDGHEVWTSATGSTIYESSPAIAGSHLAIGSVDGTLWLLDTGDGAVLGTCRLPPGHFFSTPAADAGGVYAATFAEMVVAFDVEPRAGG